MNLCAGAFFLCRSQAAIPGFPGPPDELAAGILSDASGLFHEREIEVRSVSEAVLRGELDPVVVEPG
ncbi:hypothetical protein, partial [Paracoccus versutus]|uniref:hypothetical protein n=1 Tax=Paracoccus versutus TaxID=34007 RepID=UPI001AD829C4